MSEYNSRTLEPLAAKEPRIVRHVRDGIRCRQVVFLAMAWLLSGKKKSVKLATILTGPRRSIA